MEPLKEKSINRNIVECKDRRTVIEKKGSKVLIET